MNDMVSMKDYENFGSGFGMTDADSVAELSKALDTGAYGQLNGPNGQINGAALQVESLESSLKVLTYSDKNVHFWKMIPKSPSYSTVEEYNQQLSYGGNSSAFTMDGELPETQDSEYRRKASLVKFLGTTREVTHAQTLVRSPHGDVITIENKSGILWMLKQLEHALFWGNSKLAAEGREGVQFDGLDSLIPEENVLDMKGRDIEEKDINDAATIIAENYGTVTNMFLPLETMKKFIDQFFPAERIVMPVNDSLQGGIRMSRFQTVAGVMEFNPDLFLQKTAPLTPARKGGVKAPTPPALVKVEVGEATDAEFAKSGAGTYSYAVTAANRKGESIPVDATTDIALEEADLMKGVKISIQNAAAMVEPPEWFNVYRTEKDGTQKYLILRIPAQSVAASAWNVETDLNKVMPNTCTAFMGELSPEVIMFKQLAPIMKMDLARVAPAYRWMILLYGTPILYMPGRWVKIRNIKSESRNSANGLYY